MRICSKKTFEDDKCIKPERTGVGDNSDHVCLVPMIIVACLFINQLSIFLDPNTMNNIDIKFVAYHIRRNGNQ
jgi:hypothetical protein